VVIHRLPAGQSLLHPPSRCPKCERRLAFHDNVPVLGWLWLRGRCRYCAEPISVQYPLVEAATAALFAGWFWLCYFTTLRPGFVGGGLAETWPVLVVELLLIAGLVAATLIDAKFYIIPLEIPWTVTGLAVLLLPAAVALFPGTIAEVELPPVSRNGLALLESERLGEVRPPMDRASEVQLAIAWRQPGPVEVSPAPLVSSRAAVTAVGGVLGLLLSLVLLWRRWLPRSFDKPADGSASEKGGGEIPAAAHDQTAAEESRPDPDGASGTAENDPQAWPEEHPHPRREVMKELLFLAPPILGALVAFWIGPGGEWPAPLRVPGGVLLGYLAGAGIVWIVRILGTLGFGREAMGLGDMHLLAAVGAVAGWEVPVIAFFGAPFLGLAWALISTGAQKLLNRQVKVIPYGPHLAAAALVVVAFREPLVTYFGRALLG
jgi:leader peptidase (prepilin peptidase)/N-methyltransferase